MDRIVIYDDNIKQFIQEDKSEKVAMAGVKEDLEKLEKILLNMYAERIEYLTYFISEAGYHGWDYNTDKFKNMVHITKSIEEYFLKMYVLVEKGLGKGLILNEDK